jgi:cyclic pyranopterin phosphate synthase
VARHSIKLSIDGGPEPHFRMIDVGPKRPTRRCAIAVGKISMGQEAYARVKSGNLPKGNALSLAEISGISGAKAASSLIPMCHPLPLDQVSVYCVPDDNEKCVTVYCQAIAFAKTGVEMEALSGVNMALLTIWDLTKGIDPVLQISDVHLLLKTGGKSGVWIHPKGLPDWLESQIPSQKSLSNRKVCVLVMSDRASSGDYEDKSGKILAESLEQAGATIGSYQVIPDEFDEIGEAIKEICNKDQPDLLLASGGTGPGPRDVTPDVLGKICDKILDGLGDYLRAESQYFTDTAWLSRMTAGMIGQTLIIALPGSPKAVQECWEILHSFIGDALEKISKQGFSQKG